MTLEEAYKKIEERFAEYPALGAIGRSLTFESTISQIMDFEGVDHQLLLPIAHEVRVVLALYAPLRELGPNIAESTGLERGKAESLATLIKAIILEPVMAELQAYEHYWYQELSKKPDTLPTQPTQTGAPGPAKPLTREELMKALEQRRAEGGNLEVMKQKLEEAARQKVVGYDALQDNSSQS